jgi:hypothetical protein
MCEKPLGQHSSSSCMQHMFRRPIGRVLAEDGSMQLLQQMHAPRGMPPSSLPALHPAAAPRACMADNKSEPMYCGVAAQHVVLQQPCYDIATGGTQS